MIVPVQELHHLLLQVQSTTSFHHKQIRRLHHLRLTGPRLHQIAQGHDSMRLHRGLPDSLELLLLSLGHDCTLLRHHWIDHVHAYFLHQTALHHSRCPTRRSLILFTHLLHYCIQTRVNEYALTKNILRTFHHVHLKLHLHRQIPRHLQVPQEHLPLLMYLFYPSLENLLHQTASLLFKNQWMRISRTMKRTRT